MVQEDFSHDAEAPNLPFYVDGSGSLIDASPAAIMRHIGADHKMLGESREEVARVNMMEKVVEKLESDMPKTVEVLS